MEDIVADDDESAEHDFQKRQPALAVGEFGRGRRCRGSHTEILAGAWIQSI